MEELSLHILDIVLNSIRAKANIITIDIYDSDQNNTVQMTIQDNGIGMNEEILSKATEPYFTTKSCKAGLGLPLLKQLATTTDGSLELTSQLQVGTRVKASFTKNHVNTPPLGKLEETVVSMLQIAPQIDYFLTYQDDQHTFQLNTKEIKEVLKDVTINNVDVLLYIKDYVKKGMQNDID